MKPLSDAFPIAPAPEAGELFLGYLLRIATYNGWEELDKFQRLFGRQGGKSTYWVGSKPYKKALRYYAQAVGMSADELGQYFDDEGFLIETASRTVYRTEVGHPVICSKCVAEKGYIKAAWHHAHINHCEEHGNALIQRCPKCEARLHWHGSLLTGCHVCHYQWEACELPSKKLPVHEQTLLSLNEDDKRAYLQQLYKYLPFALRPNDASFARFRDVHKEVEDTTACFEFAHRLAVFAQVREGFAKHRKQQVQKAMKVSGKDKLLDLINTKLIAANDDGQTCPVKPKETPSLHVPKEATSRILTANRCINHAANDNRFHLEWTESADMLGQSKHALIELISAGILRRRTHESSDEKLMSVPLNEIVAFHSRIERVAIYADRQQFAESVTWKKVRLFLSRRCKFADLVQDVLDEKVSLYKPTTCDDFLFSEVFFDKAELMKLYFPTQYTCLSKISAA